MTAQERQELISKYKDGYEEVRQSLDGFPTNSLTAHPISGKWSAAEILEHLNLTYVGTIKNFDRCLALGKPRASLDRSRTRWRRLVITRFGYFPPGANPRSECNHAALQCSKSKAKFCKI